MSCEDDYFPKEKIKLFNSLFHSVYLVFPKCLFFIADLFAMRYLWVIYNEDECCVVTQRAADIRVARLVYVRTYCVPFATLNQNKRTRLLYRHPNNNPFMDFSTEAKYSQLWPCGHLPITDIPRIRTAGKSQERFNRNKLPLLRTLANVDNQVRFPQSPL